MTVKDAWEWFNALGFVPKMLSLLLISLIVSVVVGATMLVSNGYGVLDVVKHPTEVLFVTAAILVCLAFLAYFKALWSGFKQLHIAVRVVVLYLLSLAIVLVREFFDSGQQFYLREHTFVDSVLVFAILLIAIWLLKDDFDEMHWGRFLLRLLAVAGIGFVLVIVYLIVLVMFFGLSFMG